MSLTICKKIGIIWIRLLCSKFKIPSRVLWPGKRYEYLAPTCKIEISLMWDPIFDLKKSLNSSWSLVFNMILSDFYDFFTVWQKIQEFGTRVRAWFESLRLWIDLGRWVLPGYSFKSKSVKNGFYVPNVLCLILNFVIFRTVLIPVSYFSCQSPVLTCSSVLLIYAYDVMFLFLFLLIKCQILTNKSCLYACQ